MHVGHRRTEPIRRVHFQSACVSPAGEADVIDVARTGQQDTDDAGFVRADAAWYPFIARQLQANDEINPTCRAQVSYQVGDEARTAFPITAVVVIPPVRPWRKKLVEQVAVPGGDL